MVRVKLLLSKALVQVLADGSPVIGSVGSIVRLMGNSKSVYVKRKLLRQL